MIEKTILDYLSDVLSVPVYLEVRSEPPDSFVLLEKTGSSRSNWISAATMALQSYGPSLYDAAALNETVKVAMDGAVALDVICAVRLNSDYNFTETATKRYRYQAVYDVTYYE
ncbi:MAG: hypothetical protein LIO45_00885 [Clostridiales bacterium]|nr:hypothetical protein [Clostridiales bacterium]